MGTQLYSKGAHPYYEILPEKEKKSKQLTLHSFLTSSEPRPWSSSAKYKSDFIDIFSIICVIFYIPNSLN